MIQPVLHADLSGRTVLVVGANVGIGLEAAKHFARMNPQRLICTCRSEDKCAQTTELIRKETGYTGVESWLLELNSFASVKAFADRFERDGGRLDILIANAAVATWDYEQTADGYETTLQVNHLSGALLSLLLLPYLARTAQNNKTVSRLVIVSGGIHHQVDFGKDRIPRNANIIQTLSSQDFSTAPAMRLRYSDTKLLNVLFGRALQARIPQSAPVIVTAVHPGVCDSQLSRNIKYDRFYGMLTSEEGSRQLIWTALAPNPQELDSKDVDAMRGAYVSDNSLVQPSPWVRSKEGSEAQDRIWNETWDILSKVDQRVTRSLDALST